jgi:hypothetical protein
LFALIGTEREADPMTADREQERSALHFGLQEPVYRDELNFAEFPLAALSDRLPADMKTLVYSDTIYDQGSRAPVTRTLTIAASDKYGLPTALDEEVILGLIQLTSEQKFTERRVYFTRYELIKLLGWRDKGESYRRIDQSLRRWMGVTLYYEKAWWSREDQSWVSEHFHLLEQVSLLDRERRDRRREQGGEGALAGKSFFVWNEVVWASFKAGYLKRLDFAFYKALATPISKRLYRFLDKRFYYRDALTFPLREFACEHIGLSKEYHTGEIKRRLRSAIEELERAGYIVPESPDRRFVKRARGEWEIVFGRQSRERQHKGAVPSLSPAQEKACRELVLRGIGEKKATQLAMKFDPERIAEKIALHDWLRQKDDRRMARPAGFLVRAIEEGYSLKGFPDFLRARPSGDTRAMRSSPERTPGPPPRIPPEEMALDADLGAMRALLDGLSAVEQEAFETAAVAAAEPFLAAQYQRGKSAGGSLYEIVRTQILLQHYRRAAKPPGAL